MYSDKQNVHDFWNQTSCGEELYLTSTDQQEYSDHAKARYELEGNMIS